MTQLLIDKAVLEQLVGALECLGDNTEQPPDRNCSCHISPPCNDCVNYSSLREALEMVDAALTAGRAALAVAEPTGWQPIETKPPVMEPVLMWDWKQVFIEQWWGPEFHLDKRITHWMPLPKPPKD